MAVKTLYCLGTTAATPNFFGNMQDGGSPPTAGLSSYGWGVAKSSVSTQGFWPGRLGATGTVASANAQSTSFIDSATHPNKGLGTSSSTGSSQAGDSFVAGPFTGTFAATSWALNFKLKTGTAGAVGRLRMRIWKSANADGTSATEMTSGAIVGSIVTLSTSADVNSLGTWSPGTTFTFSNEYIFFQLEWQETTAGSSVSNTVQFSIGTALVTTPDFSTGGGTVVFIPPPRRVYLRL
jgi:hypothetical protein